MARSLLKIGIVALLLGFVSAVPLENFYSYGAEHGDQSLPGNDDESTTEIPLSVSFPFFDANYNSLFVSTGSFVCRPIAS